MNRRIIALTLAVIASPAFALDIGLPFEQAQLDRQLPNIEFPPVAPYRPDARAPYEQLVVDMTLPNIEFPPVEPYVADGSAPYEQVVIDRTLPNLPARNQQLAGPR